MSNNFKNRVQEGLDGKYQGLDNGFNRLNKYIYGVQRKFYYLYGGLSGAAKTTLVDFKLLKAIQDAEKKGIELDIFYYSYEIDEDTKKSDWMSKHIYNKYKKVIPPEVISGLGNNRLTLEESELVDKETEYIDYLFSKIKFRFDATNPTGIYKELYNYSLENGNYIYEEYGNNGEKKIKSYIPNNPDKYVIITLDHIALTKLERNFTLKENIDKLSEYFIWFRNICGYTFKIIQQFNQTLNSVERQKYKGVDISPQQNDFKDSSNPYTDSDIAIGIMNPYKMDMTECLGYPLSIFKDKFRLIKIIKNRKGRDNIALGAFFNASAGFFSELPPSEEITSEQYDKLLNLK